MNSCRALTRASSTAVSGSGSTRRWSPSFTTLVQDNPLHERFHAQLIIALYRCGRQADALQAYKQARRILLEELGVEPCPELRSLEVAILNQDPALAAPASTAPERTPINGATSTAHDGLATRFPLVGRTDELAALRTDLASARAGRGRVALVAGEPGLGKTRLVEEIANEAAEVARSSPGGAATRDAVLRRSGHGCRSSDTSSIGTTGRPSPTPSGRPPET